MKREIDVDNFAGGGGASTGIEQATGKPVDFAINHDEHALAMHEANHPDTVHLRNDIWRVDPAEVARAGPVRIAWFSPDCTHFSKAKGRAPVRGEPARRSRDLGWVVIRWAKRARPRIIILENVEEWRGWGPLLADGRPDPDRHGETFDRWVKALRDAGYQVQWRELRACEYGAPTIRKRLFLVARRDGQTIRWPEPTHGPGLVAYRPAAQCIDWDLPAPSIFLTREEVKRSGLRCNRPLAEATMRRIARGVMKYVVEHPRPFIIPVTHTRNGDIVHGIEEPLRTVTTARGGEFALVCPVTRREHGEPREEQCAAYIAQHNTGMVGRRTLAPLSTIVRKGCTQNLVVAHLKRDFGNSTGQAAMDPVPTTTAGGGGHTSIVTAHLTHYYSSNVNGGQGELAEPMTSVLAKGNHQALVQVMLNRYAGAPEGDAVMVRIGAQAYRIVDIGMRMLSARELFRAQGFPEDYRIERGARGKRLSKEAQIAMCGNSVCPPVARALVEANLAGELSQAPTRAA